MTRIPLFLLHTVLFPGARLPLKVFEARYLDMVSACLRDKQPFGVCLIKSGQEVGDAGEPHRVGTLAHIEEWEMPTTGILHILVRGGERFEIARHGVENQLAVADISLWSPEPALEIPERSTGLVEFLREVLERAKPSGEENFEDAGWVGMRLAELLPVDNRIRQQWLEQRDPVARLADILQAMKDLARLKS